MLPDLPFVLTYTLINDYNNCPKKAWHKHIKKDLPYTPKSGAQTGGIAVHDVLKKRLKIREPLPPEYAHFEPTCWYIQNHESIKHMELQLGIRANGDACDFFDPNVRFRGVIDLALSNSPRCFLLDWKSGKRWEDPLELRLQALLMQARYPDLTYITGSYFWLRENELGKFYHINTEDAWKSLCTTAEAMFSRVQRQDWPADDNILCGWCPVPHGAGAPLDPVCIHRKERT